MSPQLSYNLAPAVGYNGMLVDAGDDYIRSFAAAVGIPLGSVVCRAGADGQCKLPTTAAEAAAAVGVAAHSHTYEAQYPSESTDYLVGAMIPVVAIGRVWVTVEEAVVAGDPVYVRYGTGPGGSQQGAVRKSTDTNAAQLLAAKFISSAAANGLAQIQVNLP